MKIKAAPNFISRMVSTANNEHVCQLQNGCCVEFHAEAQALHEDAKQNSKAVHVLRPECGSSRSSALLLKPTFPVPFTAFLHASRDHVQCIHVLPEISSLAPHPGALPPQSNPDNFLLQQNCHTHAKFRKSHARRPGNRLAPAAPHSDRTTIL